MLKKSLICWLLLFVFTPVHMTHAEEGYSDLFISVGDAMMKTKANDWSNVELIIDQLDNDWQQIDQSNSKTALAVTDALHEVKSATTNQDQKRMLDALTGMSHALANFEKEKKPVDVEKQRTEFASAMTPILADLKRAVESKDAAEIKKQYDKTLSVWNGNELIVRNQSIAYYGKIETQLGFLRIALSQDVKDFNQISKITESLHVAVNSFITGETLQLKDEGYSLQTLVDLLDETDSYIQKNDLNEAVQSLQEFITVWPSIEGEIRTRNGKLYTEIENNVPIIAGKLTSQNADQEALRSKLKAYKQSIELMQKKTSYSIWDAALIMLREGLEALLIVTALIAFLRKTKVPKQEKWIWLGAFAGLVTSILAAVLITMVFSTTSAGANRELIEGVTGIVAVVMMLGIGIWLHQKSNMQTWNHFIKKQIGVALSTGSIFSLALVSFFAIFREGAETVIFYAGMAPSMSIGELLSGIAIAIGILTVFAFVFIRFSAKIPIAPFFKIATLLIYFLAFKILGVSIHALQLTNHMNTSQIVSLPVISGIGFYPTWETLIPQFFLIIVILLVAMAMRRKEKKLLVKEV